jgi:hypothetical protein
MRVAVTNTCPSLADLLGHLIVVPGSGGFLDAALGFVLLAVDAPGADAQQNIDAVTRPLGDLGRAIGRIAGEEAPRVKPGALVPRRERRC